MTKQEYKERIGAQLDKMDPATLRQIWLIAEGMLVADNESRGGNRNAVTGD